MGAREDREKSSGWEGVVGVDGGRKQETCFEILICGSGRGLQRRDEKEREREKKRGAGAALKRGDVSCIRGAGARQTAMLAESNWAQPGSTPPRTAGWRGVY